MQGYAKAISLQSKSSRLDGLYIFSTGHGKFTVALSSLYNYFYYVPKPQYHGLPEL